MLTTNGANGGSLENVIKITGAEDITEVIKFIKEFAEREAITMNSDEYEICEYVGYDNNGVEITCAVVYFYNNYNVQKEIWIELPKE